MRSYGSRSVRIPARAGLAALLLLHAACGSRGGATAATSSASARARAARRTLVTNVSGTAIDLTAQRMTTTLRDGTSAPMWGYCVTGTAACPAAPTTPPTWAPGPTIVASPGDSLQIRLTNALPVPTSLVILGQIGGGVGSPTTMPSPAHAGQQHTTFPANTPAPTAFQPPAQGPRVRSFGTEVAAGATATLSWSGLRPGTYLYETGTLPSLEVPMGLYGVLVVTTAPQAVTTGFTPGAAYPNVSYDADAALLFSEIDPVQNKAVDGAAVAGTDFALRFDDPACSPNCYPAAVNYTPTYFLINGESFDRTQPGNTAFSVGDGATYTTGNVLVRLLNAGSRTHVPTLVGLPMSLVAEDGNPAPPVAPPSPAPPPAAQGPYKVQTEILLTAGKTYDVLVRPPPDGTAYAAGTYPVFDRSLSLSTNNHPDGGMQGFLLVDHAAAVAAGAAPGAPGMLPAAVTPLAVSDTFKVPFNTPIGGNVTTNDVAVTSVALAGAAPAGLALNPDGSFTYAPGNTLQNTTVTFQYTGNGGAAGTATVSLLIGTAGGAPTANPDAYTSHIAPTSAAPGRFSAPRPGVLANDTDPSGYLLTAGGVTASTCASVSLDADGSFTATSTASTCSFSYVATNAQGTASPPAKVTIQFGTASLLGVTVVDAATPTVAISDYRWTLQEDLTFKPTVAGTPSVSTRTIGTSFHRSHMTVVATGCVGPISCGSGQTIRGAPAPLTPQTTPDQVVLDPTKRYYISILPGDAANPVDDPTSPTGHTMGGAEIGYVAATTAAPGHWAPLTVKLQATPLVTAQMSVYIYEDNQPTNGQNEPVESPLGGFNIILWDPAGRTGDTAGQQSYDAFNMPLSNALLGTQGCPDELNAATNGTGTSASGNLVGLVYTCPNDPNDGTPAADPVKYALAGHALIKNLTPARYDVIAHPGAAREGAGEVWWQTETLEGTAAQDAFVGVNEPGYFQEFGPPGPHVTIGFVNPARVAAYAQYNHLTGSATITGKVTNQHMSRPSNVTLWDSGSYEALSSTTCEVVLNSASGGGPAVAAAQCDPDGNFTLTGIAPGAYDVAIFDQWLDQIIQNVAVSVPQGTIAANSQCPAGPGTCACSAGAVCMGDLPVLSWFTQYDQNIYLDLDGNGVYDPGEPGISNVPLTVRYRNGAPSNVTLSDSAGNGMLAELFPLFNWYVAEADTTRFKQTGVSVVVDGGGRPDTTGPGAGIWSSTYATGQSSVRTEQPGALSYGFQGFISQRNRVDWGRTPYAAGENGGIVGTVVYSSTRPFDDMRLNVQTIWEPLVPRVTVNLYQAVTLPDGSQTLTKIDSTLTSSWDDYVNLVSGADQQQYLIGSDYDDQAIPKVGLRYPPGTVVGGVDVSGTAAPQTAYPAGAQVNLQCPGQLPGTTAPPPWDLTKVDPYTNYTLGGDRYRCYDGWHAWNQVQAAPYDGRYVFPSPAYVAAHPLCSATVTTNCTAPAPGQTLVSLPPGAYVVEAVTPPGYEIVKEEDKNILIGDAFVAPATQQFGTLADIFILPDQATLNNANPYDPGTGDPGFQSDPTTNLGIYTNSGAAFPECVGTLHRVPDYLSLYPQAQQVAPFAGMDRPLCDRKKVVLADQMQASAHFFVFTQVPAASNDTGIILDDATSEYNAYAPDFGEKASVPFVPVSIRDFAGNEIGRTYSDQWGAYNMMTPSSWLVNPPTPSGYGPNMLVTCMNDPGPIPDPTDPTGTRLVTDPSYNPAYSNFCYTNPFMPGQTTYLDTPVLPTAAFAAGYNPADCSLPDAAPAILRVDGSAGWGPWLPASGGTLTIAAQGDQQVMNPAYEGPFASAGLISQRTITRHYGFGAAKGTVRIGNATFGGGGIASWSDAAITVHVPSGTPSGELSITTAAGRTSVDTVTVTIEGTASTPPRRVPDDHATIQAAIEAANPGDLILVNAGTYDELVVMWKPVRLQGVGAGSVLINAAKYPTSKLAGWRPLINGLFAVDPVTGNQTGISQVDPLPTQEITGGVVLLEPTVLGSEEGAGITVLAKNLPAGDCSLGDPSTYGQFVTQSNFRCAPSRIDGFSVTGGDAGGGIYVNGWAHGLEVSNNRVYGNAGAFNGGIRVGIPYLELESFPTDAAGNVLTTPTGHRIAGFGYDVDVHIHHNSVTKNGTVEGPTGQGGAGGGISVCTGTDNYRVDHNWVCGNYSSSDGGGIGHLGFSQGGTIAFNDILFNQSFQQTTSTHGGGLFVGGEPPVAGAVSLGTGDLTINANLIRGNLAEGGHGGGVRFAQVNGADVAASRNPSGWHRITFTNNVVVDNVAGWAGGGVAMADTLRAEIVNNTIAANDSTGIAGVVLAGGAALPAEAPGTAGVGYPSPAGIVSEPTTAALLNAMPNAGLRTANAISQPSPLENNVVWKNRSFYYSGDGRLCAGNSVASASAASCTVLTGQGSTGACPSGAAYWDLGVLSDPSPAPGALRLHPTYSDITSGYTGAAYGGSYNTNGDPGLVSMYCNGSRAVPELAAVINPPTVMNFQVAATVDEGANYVNLRFGPLYTENPASPGTPFGNYHIAGASSAAYGAGTSSGAPARDFDDQSRPSGSRYDIGADEYYSSPTALTAVIAP